MIPRLALHTLVILSGMVTRYDADPHLGNDRRCGGTYNLGEQWVAADVDNGPYHCGDWLAICAAGECRVLQVRDSGPLSQFCVMDGDVCRDILVDVPQHVAAGWFPGMSARAVVVNATAARQRMEAER